MGQPVNYVVFVAILSCASYLLYAVYKFGSRDKRLPPGPPTIPVLGNAHLLIGNGLEKKFKKWAEEYGNIVSLKVGSGTFILLNDKRTVHDLMDKRSAIYTDRPIDQQVTSAMRESFAFIDANHMWRASRKIASHFVSPKNLDENIMAIQEAETSQLLFDLSDTPEHFTEHIKRTTSSVASIVIFGFRAATIHSFWATVSSGNLYDKHSITNIDRCVYEAIDIINLATTPGSYLPIDNFPFLQYVPDFLVPSKKRATDCFHAVTAIWSEARSQVVARRLKGDHRESLTDRVIGGDIKSDKEMTPSIEANFLGTLHQGAADTTASAMLTSVLYMAKHPWVQKKAQVELDRVCGDGRSPTWQDFKSLPYINCIIKEALRVRPIVPGGVPVRASRDDYFDGYLIPKDAAVFTPAYSIQHDPKLYPEPHKYNPDRFLDHPQLAMSYAGSPDYENRDHYAYGAGRRICVGIHLAERTQWRITARMLWAFDIKPALDENGQEIEVDTDAYEDGLLIQPKKYKVRFIPRSEKHLEAIRREYEAVEEFLKRWE